MRQRVPIAISIAALVVAVLGMTPIGQAAKRLVIPSASVGTVQLKRNAVTTTKVANRTLLAIDFRAGQLPAGAQGAQGAPGAPGPKGDKGDKGDEGDPGVVGTVRARFVEDSVGDGVYLRLSATCNAGEKAIGGGVGTTSTASDVSVRESKPTRAGSPIGNGEEVTSWTGALLNQAGGVASATLTVWVLCG